MTCRGVMARPFHDRFSLSHALALLISCTAAFVTLAPGARAQNAAGASMSPQALLPDAAAPLELSREEAMWAAIAFEDAPRLKDLLSQGTDPNKPETLSQMTPLMAAETAQIAKILLDAGADPALRDRTGRTALHHAVKMREGASVVQMLARTGVDLNARAKDSGQNTPLLTAIEHYLEDKDRQETALVIRILIHLGADINAADVKGDTALAIAAAHNQPELIRLLIELGADPARRMGNGRTPLDYAREANAHDAIQALAAAPSKQAPAN
jgi:ankyrin repeat protein